jgi:hypothetical protein
MQWSKFSLLLVLLLSFSVFAEERFTSVQCLNSDFETSVKNEGKFFGLIKNDLLIKKNKCLIEVTFKGILETVWTVDICREPIHMKVKSKGSQSVYKRIEKCDKEDKSDYCYFRDELVLNLQDQGLIFAKGIKEKLSDAHGQVYCSYLLLKNYLDDGKLFSQFDKELNLYKKDASCEIPKIESQDKTQQPAEGSLREELESKKTDQYKEDAKALTPKSSESEQKEKPRF